MATNIIYRVPISQAWAAGGSISLELSPTPFTITRMVLVNHLQFTISGGAFYNDWADRIITNLTLSGGGQTYFDYRNLRPAYWLSHFQGIAPRRPLPPATTVLIQTLQNFHFGVRPQLVDARSGGFMDNPWDLSGGIAPQGRGNLTLQGSFAGAANGVGSATTTTTAGGFDIYLYGVRPEAGDTPGSYLPQAFPNFSMQTITPSATSSAFSTETNIPAGGFLRAMMIEQHRVATSLPRANDVLNSLRIYNQQKGGELISFGGQSGSAADYQAAEMLSQVEAQSVLAQPYGDDVLIGTVGTPSLNATVDAGLVFLPLYKLATKAAAHPLYGVDMRSVATGDLRLQYGVANATAIEMLAIYQRYYLNPDHPDTAHWG